APGLPFLDPKERRYALAMDENRLSPDAHDRLVAELDNRSTVRRTEISEWIGRAREHGDIRENADYDAAKNEQAHNEARIRHLEGLLERSVVVEGTQVASVVEAGTVVEVRIDDDTSTYLVGSIEERLAGVDVVSPGSPLGRCLLGRAPGEIVEYEAPGGRFQVEILSIRPSA
ncbi:MAG: GreA/GreB family elongation factor, partial [Acidimicrobiia bacterium]